MVTNRQRHENDDSPRAHSKDTEDPYRGHDAGREPLPDHRSRHECRPVAVR
jgi:hypothetical protein